MSSARRGDNYLWLSLITCCAVCRWRTAQTSGTEERAANLPSIGTLEERRTALIARWRGAGKCDVDLIQRVCDSWENGEISVGFAKGVIVLTFVGAYGVPEEAELAALQDAVEHTIPCHLTVSYLYRYLLVREVSAMTVDELQGHTMHDFAF